MTGAASGFSSRMFSKSIRFLILLLRTLGWVAIVGCRDTRGHRCSSSSIGRGVRSKSGYAPCKVCLETGTGMRLATSTLIVGAVFCEDSCPFKCTR